MWMVWTYAGLSVNSTPATLVVMRVPAVPSSIASMSASAPIAAG